MSSETPALNEVDDEIPARSRKRSMRSRLAGLLVRLSGFGVLLALALFVAGFLDFAERVVELKVPDGSVKGDGIVVLTGGQQRIEHALDLLQSGAARRLLISGVNPATTGSEIRRLTRSSKSLFACCVDIGHDAIDTIGNAYETARWIDRNGYRRVFLVTNNYHMPRSLLELRRVDPKTEFIPYPVINNDLKSRNWLHNPPVMRRLVTEYVKYTLARTLDWMGLPADRGLRTDRAREQDAPLITDRN